MLKNKAFALGLLLVTGVQFSSLVSSDKKVKVTVSAVPKLAQKLNVRYSIPVEHLERLEVCVDELVQDPKFQALSQEDKLGIADVVSAHYDPAKSTKSVSVLTKKVSDKCGFKNDAAFKKMHDTCVETMKCKAFKALSPEQKQDVCQTVKAAACTRCKWERARY